MQHVLVECKGPTSQHSEKWCQSSCG